MNNTLPNIKDMYNNLQNKNNNKNFITRIFICLFAMSLGIFATETFGSSVTMLTQQVIKEKRVTINLTNKPLNTILAEIQKQTKIDFGFSKNLDPATMGVFNVVCKDKTVEEVLNALMLNTKFTYRIVVDKIIIEPKKQTRTQSGLSHRIDVAGRVFDKRYQPIVGATVIVVGTNKGAITDEQGNFRLNMEAGQSLEASFIGYKAQTEIITNAQNNLVFNLNPDNMVMDEVIVTGYQNTEKSKTVGSYTTIKAEDLNLTGVSNIAEALQGQVAGMMVTRSSARAGATPNIQIRGQATLLGNQDPIWVVDGIIQSDPIKLNAREGLIDDLSTVIGNQVSWLNPSDIETITVLKDASATAIYGSRASNGVIVITTKKSKTEKATISYSGSLTVKPQANYGMFNYMNSKERIAFSEEVSGKGYTLSNEDADSYQTQLNTYEGSERMYFEGLITKSEFLENRSRLETINTDWLNLLTRTSVAQNHNISISANKGKTSYRVSAGYMEDKGQEIKNDMKQFTFASNINVQLHEKVKINFSVNGSLANTNEHGSSAKRPMDYALSTSRSIPAYNEDGSYASYLLRNNYFNKIDDMPLSFSIFNELDNTWSKSKRSNISLSFNFDWQITKWLKYEFVGGLSYSNNRTDRYQGEQSWSIANALRGYDYGKYGANAMYHSAAVMPVGGTLKSNFVYGDSYNVQNKLVFNKTIKEKHYFNAMLAHEISSRGSYNYANNLWGYVPERGNMLIRPTPPEDLLGGIKPSWKEDFGLLEGIYDGGSMLSDLTNNFMSIFATFVYSYDNKYVFNASVRNDFSNRFGQDVNNRFDPTYSFGLKWRMGEESFLKGSQWVNYLDLSATYGIQGNATLTRSPDLILSQGKIDNSYKEFFSRISSLPNKNLSWERTNTINLSLSTRLFNAVTFNMDYYKRESNAIIPFNIPEENGIKRMDINGGIIYNEGIEGTVSFSPIVTRNFGMNVSINSSKNWNKGGKSTLEKITLGDYLGGATKSVIKEGYPVGAMWRYSYAGLDPADGSPMFNYMDISTADAIADPTKFMEYVGTKNPYFTGGVNLSLRYRKLTFSTMFNVQLGGNINLPNPYKDFGSFGSTIPDPIRNISKDVARRWKKSGDENNTYIPAIQKQPHYTLIPGQNQETNSLRMWEQSDIMTISSSYLRCNNMSLNYNFDNKKLSSIGISSLSLKASVSNVFVIANKRLNGFDPELVNEVMPRTYSFGLSISF